MSNVYYDPEKFGLTVVGEVEWSEPCYSFDTTVLWRNEAGEFLWASDSGCSCPCPFEDDSLETLTRGSFHEFARFLNGYLADDNNFADKDYAAPQVVDLLAKALAL